MSSGFVNYSEIASMIERTVSLTYFPKVIFGNLIDLKFQAVFLLSLLQFGWSFRGRFYLLRLVLYKAEYIAECQSAIVAQTREKRRSQKRSE